ncbi:uncharacterized protein PHALS_02011 [Plasmopara halstedii]|uniref:Uncharacterized protein n=1 Tax=Plasmopara halstedii TaxID=4781 RepID=A0A0N7L705_PLAHL|nr:uncharacterized protein PHALS_02011 [Plasmopara halstedii]CEG45731.1 hypothetical protein PHALS_02011 [Plasmopara halstedii]|eukprot:XP_024582100.1 hypothetical protein PHALS_02011 [Plasmopara halstedii]
MSTSGATTALSGQIAYGMLLDAGFPASTISTLQPATAHHIISKKILFSQFEDIRKEQQVEQAAERLSAEVAADGKKKSEQDAPSAVVVTKSTAVFSKHHIGASPNLQRVKI